MRARRTPPTCILSSACSHGRLVRVTSDVRRRKSAGHDEMTRDPVRVCRFRLRVLRIGLTAFINKKDNAAFAAQSGPGSWLGYPGLIEASGSWESFGTVRASPRRPFVEALFSAHATFCSSGASAPIED